MLKIVTAPNSVLSSVTKPISKVDSCVLKIIEEMKKALLSTTDPKGVGLAAPQVGKSMQIFITKPADNSKISVFINPKIIEKSSEQDFVKRPARNASASVAGGPKKINAGEKASKKLEGCLSLPTIWGPVLRASSLTISYLDEQGNKHTKGFNGFMATIIQHEMDHLEGILFPKRALEQKGTLYRSSKNEKGEDEFEKIEI